MAECECLSGCPFFNDKMTANPGLTDMYKKKYCLGNNEQCARHMVFEKLGKGNVPGDLYPNQRDKVEDILAGRYVEAL